MEKKHHFLPRHPDPTQTFEGIFLTTFLSPERVTGRLQKYKNDLNNFI
jgi:hypothetical protein